MTTSEREVVAALGQEIAQRIGEPRYDVWFARWTKIRIDGDRIVIGVPNRFYQEWLQKTFAEDVAAAAASVFGQVLQAHFVIDGELFRASRQAQVEAGGEPGSPPKKPETHVQDQTASVISEMRQPGSRPGPRPQKAIRRWHRLSDFVVGACNRVAHASALSIVEDGGLCANPLVLHGTVGTGKTHLLEGVYAGLRKGHPDWRVCYVTAEDFTNRFVQAMRLGKLSGFRRHFRDCDALLLDDLHFLSSKPATQEEFLHTFDALLANGKQLVVTCDCHPRLAGEFGPELTDRLLGGAVWGLMPPDGETRLGILRSKTARAAFPLTEDVLRYIAEQLRGNVRELEGAVHSVQHYSRVSGRPADLQLTREALGDHLRHAVRLVQLADIDSAVCKALRLDSGSLQSRQRSWAVSHPRMLAIYLARKHTSAAYSEIGHYFGKRNHSTAVAAEKKIRQWLQDDSELVLGERRLRVSDVILLVERELEA
ncbi:MAG TPA: chromosomal replication initiator protein DnaA [Gemmataceae bacterium]|nr:chromosomal replication initiator protein DnaA [Gemmataceae bacterium]